jgi:hypothetical protein
MKSLLIALWIQVLAGFICMVLAFGEMHSGAMFCEGTDRLRADYQKVSASPTFKAPPEIGGFRHERFPELLHTLAKDSMHNAGYWFLFSCATWVGGGVMLALAYRAQRTKAT